MKFDTLRIVTEKVRQLMDDLDAVGIDPAHVTVRVYDPEENPQAREGAPGTATDVKLTRGGDVTIQPQKGVER